MSLLRWMPLTLFWERTIQPCSWLLEAISEARHKIVFSRTASAPMQQSGPTTEQSRTCAVGSTCALFATGSGHSRVLTYAGRQSLFEIERFTSRYFLRDPMLNQFSSSSARPRIVAPLLIY